MALAHEVRSLFTSFLTREAKRMPHASAADRDTVNAIMEVLGYTSDEVMHVLDGAFTVLSGLNGSEARISSSCGVSEQNQQTRDDNFPSASVNLRETSKVRHASTRIQEH